MLCTFCTEAKVLLNDEDKKGVYKLVAGCKFLESYVDMRQLTERITSKAEAAVKAVIKDVRKKGQQASQQVVAGNSGSSTRKKVSVARI